MYLGYTIFHLFFSFAAVTKKKWCQEKIILKKQYLCCCLDIDLYHLIFLSGISLWSSIYFREKNADYMFCNRQQRKVWTTLGLFSPLHSDLWECHCLVPLNQCSCGCNVIFSRRAVSSGDLRHTFFKDDPWSFKTSLHLKQIKDNLLKTL